MPANHHLIILRDGKGPSYLPETHFPYTRSDVLADLWSDQIESRLVERIFSLDIGTGETEDVTKAVAKQLADRTLEEGDERTWVTEFAEQHGGFDTYIAPENRYLPEYPSSAE